MAKIEFKRSRITDKDIRKILLEAGISERELEAYFWGRECYTAVEDGKVLGSYVLDRKYGNVAEINNLIKDPKERRKPIGTILLRHAIKVARRRGLKRLLASTANSSTGWLATYQKVGFRIDGIGKDYFSKEGEKPVLENNIPRRDLIKLALDL